MFKNLVKPDIEIEKYAKMATAETLSYHLLSVSEVCRSNGWYKTESLILSASHGLEDMLLDEQEIQPFDTILRKKSRAHHE